MLLGLLAAAVLLVELIFGARDTWVSAFGVIGSATQGVLIGLLALIPVVVVGVSVLYAIRRHDRPERILRNAAIVALSFGIPIGLVLIIGAAY